MIYKEDKLIRNKLEKYFNICYHDYRLRPKISLNFKYRFQFNFEFNTSIYMIYDY